MDAGERAADEAFKRMRQKINRIYGNAQREIREKLAAHVRKFEAEDRRKRQQLAEGKITKEEYERWVKLKVWQGEQWQAKLDSVTETLTHANESALRVINGERVGVFAENATYQNFLADQAGVVGAWNIYDQATVSNLLAKNPRLLPQRRLDRKKEKAWNRRQINNCVLQGILQGEGIDQIANRMSETTGSTNRNQMLRTARTAMTGAQNAGRIESMRNQIRMGIRVKKLWIATLDKRTRDAHAELDGQTAEIEEPFESELGEIMYPGDPFAAPGNVYNCRCKLGYAYPDFPDENDQRIDNETKEVIEYETYREWKRDRFTKANTMRLVERKVEDAEQPQEPPRKPFESYTNKLHTAVSGEDYEEIRKLVEASPVRVLFEQFGDTFDYKLQRKDGESYGAGIDFYYPDKPGMSRYSILFHESGHIFDQRLSKLDGLSFTEIHRLRSITGFPMVRQVASASDRFLAAIRKDREGLAPFLKDRPLFYKCFIKGKLENATVGIQDAMDGFFGKEAQKLIKWGHGTRYYNERYRHVVLDSGLEPEVQFAYQELGMDASNLTKTKMIFRDYEIASELWANCISALTSGGDELEAFETYMPETVRAIREILGMVR